jgi:hypothetical protein
MSATAGEYKLHDYLKQFLLNAEVKYTPVTARLVSLSPAQLTQDDECFLEAQSLSKELLSKEAKLAKTDLARTKVLIRLADWKFVVSRIPNSADYFLDIDVKTFEVLPPGPARGPEVLKSQLINILETNPYSRLFTDSQKRLAKTRSDSSEAQGAHLGRGQPQLQMEQRTEEGSNQNKYSFRPRYANPNLLTPRDSVNEGPNKPLDPEAGVKTQAPSIRLSGLNGRKNMKQLKEFKQSYNTASQESLTHQVLGSDRLEKAPINGNRHEEGIVKSKEGPIFLKKRPFEDEELQQQKSMTIYEDQSFKNIASLEKKKHGISLGIFEDSQTQKKLKVPQRFELQIGDVIDEGLNYDELMDCLALERGLVHWEDLVFSKDVVKFLKHNISDLLDKK